MYQFILFIHVMVAAFIILLVLVQQGKGATMGAAFGSGASQTVFGARGTGSVLYNVTMICIAIFFATSLAMNYFATSAYKQAGKMVQVQAPVPVRQAPQNVAPVQPTAPASVPAPVLIPVSTHEQAPAATNEATPVSSQPASRADQIPVKK